MDFGPKGTKKKRKTLFGTVRQGGMKGGRACLLFTSCSAKYDSIRSFLHNKMAASRCSNYIGSFGVW